VHSSRSES